MSQSAPYPEPPSLLRSLLSNWFGLVLAIAIGLLLPPFVVHSLGAEDYGLWTLIISITSQLMVLDLGVRNSLVKYIPELRMRRSTQGLSELVSSAAFLLGIAAVVGLLILVSISPFLGRWFGLDPRSVELLRLVFLISALDASFDLAFGVFDGALAGSERYDVMNAINASRLVVNAVLLVVVLKAGYGLIGMAISIFGVRLLHRLASCRYGLRVNPGVQLRARAVSRATLRTISSYGLWAALAVASMRLIYQSDALVVGFFLGTVAVTVYAIPVILVEQLRMFAQTASTILTPRFSSLDAAGERDTIRLLLLKWARYGEILAIAIGAPLLITGGDFIRLWMGSEFEDSIPILALLTIPLFFTTPAVAFGNYLHAINRHRVYARLLLAEAACNLVLSVILVQRLGIVGVAIGTLIPSILFRAILVPWRVARIASLRISEYVHHAFVSCVPLALLHLALLGALKYGIGAHTWPRFAINNAIGLLVFGSLVFVFYLGRDDREYIARRLEGWRARRRS
jgi:O-antigen/teichoic acid export membrane protein